MIVRLRRWSSRLTDPRIANVVAWVGIVAAIAYSTAKSRAQAEVGVAGWADLIRGVVPCLAALLVMPFLVTRLATLRRQATCWALAAFAVTAVASTAWSVSKTATFERSVVLAAFYLLVLTVALAPVSWRTAFDQLVGFAELTVVAVLMDLVVQFHDVTAPLPSDGSTRLRGIVPTISSDLLGTMCAVTLVAVVCGVGPLVTRRRWVRVALGITAAGELIGTRARVALLLAVVAVVVVLVLRVRDRRRLMVGAVVASIVAVAVLGLFGEHVVEYLSRHQSRDAFFTGTGRLNTWSDSIHIWSRRPVTGLGYYSGHRFELPTHANVELTSVDNTYLEALVDVGLLGASALLLGVVFGLVRLSRGLRVMTLTTVGYEAHATALAAVTGIMVLSSVINPSLQAVNFACVVMLGVLLISTRLPLSSPVVQARPVERGKPHVHA